MALFFSNNPTSIPFVQLQNLNIVLKMIKWFLHRMLLFLLLPLQNWLMHKKTSQYFDILPPWLFHENLERPWNIAVNKTMFELFANSCGDRHMPQW